MPAHQPLFNGATVSRHVTWCGANVSLHSMGARIVVVQKRPSCPAIASLPVAELASLTRYSPVRDIVSTPVPVAIDVTRG